MTTREEVWLRVAECVARAENAVNRKAPGTWADQVLEDFDAKFPEAKKVEELERRLKLEALERPAGEKEKVFPSDYRDLPLFRNFVVGSTPSPGV